MYKYAGHSFNNFKMIKNEFIKGARFFKVDLSFISKESCLTYGGFNN